MEIHYTSLSPVTEIWLLLFISKFSECVACFTAAYCLIFKFNLLIGDVCGVSHQTSWDACHAGNNLKSLECEAQLMLTELCTGLVGDISELTLVPSLNVITITYNCNHELGRSALQTKSYELVLVSL